VMFKTALGSKFSGQIQPLLYWTTTNAINGASNVVLEVAMAPYATNNLLSDIIYQTSLTTRFWSSNSLQIAALPVITVTNYAPLALYRVRVGRLGTNAADAALGNVRLLMCDLQYTTTNKIGRH
jgi:hypothetical protein